jgi:hypothetical protein
MKVTQKIAPTYIRIQFKVIAASRAVNAEARAFTQFCPRRPARCACKGANDAMVPKPLCTLQQTMLLPMAHAVFAALGRCRSHKKNFDFLILT